jgi:hypothetical protein
MENVGLFYGLLEYFTDVRNILCPFSNVVFIWYIFPRFGILCQEKSGNPADVSEQSTGTLLFLQGLRTKISMEFNLLLVSLENTLSPPHSV